MLSGRKLLITGIANSDSIAFAVAERAQLHGAEVVLTAFPRDRDLAAETAALLPHPAELHELDLTDREATDALTETLRGSIGRIDGALHAVAFAPRDALSGNFLEADPDGIGLAFQTSAVSYATLARVVNELHDGRPASLVGLDFDAGGAWPVYNWMGVCKSALAAVSRYLARDLGPKGIRSNLVAAGPLHTRAAGGIPGFDQLTSAWENGAPIAWDANDPAPVADAVCFLLSDMARSVTGEVLHVDGGYHAMAAPLDRESGAETRIEGDFGADAAP